MALLGCLPPPRAWAWTALASVAWLALGAAAEAQGPALRVEEYQLKAAFLYNFAKFVEWPAAGATGPVVIVVFGWDPFGPALENAVWGKSVNSRPLVVRRVSRVEQVLPCHLLFISAQERRRAPEVLEAVAGAGVLTVGEWDDFLQQGGAVRFVMEDRKIRFVVNLDAAKRSGVRISSRLLSLAQVVRD